MAQARQLKSGRWRIYEAVDRLVRDPQTGMIPTFDRLSQAKIWWSRLNPTEPALQEADRCVRCGAYFGPDTPWLVVGGRQYHRQHAPRPRSSSLTLSHGRL